jgi:hypothetical protein
VKATLNTHSLRGPVERAITVTTNDPDQPTVVLTLKAHVQVSLEVLPTEHVSLDFKPTAWRLLRKEATETGALEVSAITTSQPWLRATAQPYDPAKPLPEGVPQAQAGDWILEVTHGGEAPMGRSAQWIEFATGLTRQPHTRLDVHVFKQPAVNVSVSSVQLRSPHAGTTAEQVVVFSLRPGADAQTLKVEADTPGVSIDVAPDGPRVYRARVQWDGNEPAIGTLTFRVGDERVALPLLLERTKQPAS